MSELPAKSDKTESAADRLARLAVFAASPAPERAPGQGMPPDERRCSGITKTGTRCTAWALKDSDKCSGHAGNNLTAARLARKEAAEARKEARQSVRERAAAALDDDFPAVLDALRIGLAEGKPSDRARVAVSYVQLVFGRQLQKPEDEQPAGDPLDVATLTREERDKLKAQLVADHPELAARLRVVG